MTVHCPIDTWHIFFYKSFKKNSSGQILGAKIFQMRKILKSEEFETNDQ